MMQSPLPTEVVSALASAYAGITAAVTDLDDLDLLLPSACRGWSVADLLFHVTLDAQRALVALAIPADAAPDVDFITYWSDSATDPDAALAHAQWVRRSTAAFARPCGIVPLWSETATAAMHAAARADPTGRISTQGHVLTVPNFVATLVTEAVVHHLDLIALLPGANPPATGGVAITRRTLDGLAAPDGLPPTWGELEAIRKATGRAALTTFDRSTLGDRADLFPLLS